MFILSELKNKTLSSISFKKEELIMEQNEGEKFIIKKHPKLKDTVRVSLSRIDGNIVDVLASPILEAFYYYDYKDVFYDIGEEVNYFVLVTFVIKTSFGESRFIWIATSEEIILETHSLLSLGESKKMIKKILEDTSKETLFLNFNRTHSNEFSLTEYPDKDFDYSNFVKHYSIIDYSRRLFKVNDFYIAYSEEDLPLFICKDLEAMLNYLDG